MKPQTHGDMDLGAEASREGEGGMRDGAKSCRERKRERTAVSTGTGHTRVTVIVEIATLVS